MRKLRNCRSKPRKTIQCPSETFELHAKWPPFCHPSSYPVTWTVYGWGLHKKQKMPLTFFLIANVQSIRKPFNLSQLFLAFTHCFSTPMWNASGRLEHGGQRQLQVLLLGLNHTTVPESLKLSFFAYKMRDWLDWWPSKCVLQCPKGSKKPQTLWRGDEDWQNRVRDPLTQQSHHLMG